MWPIKAVLPGPATNCRLGASQRPAATVEEAAHTYDAAAMAYAAGTDTDTNFPPTDGQIATLGQPVRASDVHPVLFYPAGSLLLKSLRTLLPPHILHARDGPLSTLE
jgi:hypothetical protein